MSKGFSISRSLRYLKENKAKMFWLWMLYQAVKGSLTLTLIWIPLFLLWKNNGGLKTFWPDWGAFIVAFLAFMLSHVLLLHPILKRHLKSITGDIVYWLVFNIVSLGLFCVVLWQALNAPRDIIWTYQVWHGIVAFILSILGVGLIVAGSAIINPFSILSFREGYMPTKPGILRITRHPVLFGVILWAFGHLIANGEASLVVFFALNTVFGILGAVMVDRRRQKALGSESWKVMAHSTSFFPNPLQIPKALAETIWTRPIVWGRIAIWICLTALLVWGHWLILSVSPLTAIGAGI